MGDVLSPEERLRIVAELCPKLATRRPCDSFELAQARAIEILGPGERAEVTADYLLMRAIDRFVAGTLSATDLYRCRILAYYMTFAAGGEEWARWGVAATVRPGDFAPLPDAADLDDLLPLLPDGPPWREPSP
jgi:hypothetical protein